MIKGYFSSLSQESENASMGESTMREQSLDKLVATFLIDMAHANRSLHTHRAYAADLAQLCAYHQGAMQTITAEVLRNFFEMHLHLSPATRARKQAAVACFLTWAYQHELLDNNPMLKIERVQLDPPQPRGMERTQIERILKAIPAKCQRDQLFSAFSWKQACGSARDSLCMWRISISRLIMST